MVSINIQPQSPPPDLTGLEPKEQIAEIKAWFFANYEDPVHNTPYESKEGGYQYIWGGPYDAREEISDAFPEVPEKILEEVINDIEDEGAEWAPNDNRLYNEEDESPYDALQRALDGVESALLLAKPVPSAIGGNNPPEEIGVPPYRDEDKAYIQGALNSLRLPENELAEQPQRLEKASAQFKAVADKLGDFFAAQGIKAADAYSEELGKKLAWLTAIGVYILWERLLKAYEVIQTYLSSLL